MQSALYDADAQRLANRRLRLPAPRHLVRLTKRCVYFGTAVSLHRCHLAEMGHFPLDARGHED